MRVKHENLNRYELMGCYLLNETAVANISPDRENVELDLEVEVRSKGNKLGAIFARVYIPARDFTWVEVEGESE